MPLTIVLKNRFLLFLINYHNKKKEERMKRAILLCLFQLVSLKIKKKYLSDT